MRARFEALLVATGASEQDAATLRADFAGLLGEVRAGGLPLDWEPLELSSFEIDLEGWDWPNLDDLNWDFDDGIGATLASIQAQDAAQLDALTKEANTCALCGQPLPDKGGGVT